MRRMGRGIRGAFVDNARRPTLAAVFAATAVGLASAADTPGRVRIETVSYDQTTIEVLDQGSGPAVVMIPSLGRGAADFDALAARVAAAGYRVLRPQPRAIGASTGPQSGITLHSLAEDVARVIDFSGEGQAVVLGHAAGNRTARAVAAYYRDKVAAVVLLAAGERRRPRRRSARRCVIASTCPYPTRSAFRRSGKPSSPLDTIPPSGREDGIPMRPVSKRLPEARPPSATGGRPAPPRSWSCRPTRT
jgi:pimeloyl-ACP methyl ester carboxylesterase